VNYISSLSTTTKELADSIRGHWEIENSSHWILYVTYKKDDSPIQRGDGPENMATFRRFAMNMARLSPVKVSMRGKLKHSAWSDDFREKLLFG
jgi:predicted transposase YbfD/YdcC